MARLIYLSICLPYLQYCNILWSSCTITKLQSINVCQKKLVRLILKKSRMHSASPLFKKLKLLKLCDLNNLNMAVFVFKSINELIPSPVTFVYNAPGPYNLRRNDLLNVPFTRSRQSQRFISVRGAKFWNDLSLDIRSCRTIHTLKKKLKRHYLEQYY